MFKGVIKQNSRKILLELLEEIKFENVYVGCCGAFTIEILLARNFELKKIVSSDVSVFTNAIGNFLHGRDYDIKLKSEALRHVSLDKYANGNLLEKTALILFLHDLSDFHKMTNLYNKRMYENYLIAADQIIRQKMARLTQNHNLFKDKKIEMVYHAEDVVDFVKRVPAGNKDLFIAFPPFFFGDYEKQYQYLVDNVDCTSLMCDYEMFNDKSLLNMVKYMHDKGIRYIIGTNKVELFKDMPGVNVVAYDYFTQTEVVSFITNIDLSTKFAQINSQFLSGAYGVKIGNEKTVDDLDEKTKIQVKEIPPDLFDSFRRSRISKKIKKLSMPMLKFGVFADDVLIGIFGVDMVKITYQTDHFYLLSDLPICNHRNVAKLIAGIPTCKEVRDFIKNKYLFDYESILTTAFTNSPVSMKYRNFWKVDNRGKDKSSGMNFINYIAPMGKMTVQEIYNKWLKLQLAKEQNAV